MEMQVLPPAVHRGGRGFADNWRAGQIQPRPAPLDTLFDVEHLVKWAEHQGTLLHTVLHSLMQQSPAFVCFALNGECECNDAGLP